MPVLGQHVTLDLVADKGNILVVLYDMERKSLGPRFTLHHLRLYGRDFVTDFFRKFLGPRVRTSILAGIEKAV
jgi:hypothetical protein